MMQKAVNLHYLPDLSRIWKVFMVGVNSVHPQEIVRNFVRREGEKLVVGNAKYDLEHNVYAVGFGKAVNGMVRPVENVLQASSGGSHLQKGIISIPVGIKKQLGSAGTSDIVEYLEGAKNNIPDEAAFAASKRIVSLVQGLKEQDILLVLISGGGSALLPYPVPPLTLDEKLAIVKSLSRAGANISELNTVRKALSGTKGGRLAQMTKAKTVSLILSDVIGSPLDVIASGPTVANSDPPEAAAKVLQKYKVPISDTVRSVLQAKALETVTGFSHVNNNVIGSSDIALSAIETFLNHQKDNHSLALVLSSSLQGEAAEVGASMAELAAALSGMVQQEQYGSDLLSDHTLQALCVDPSKKTLLEATVARCRQLKCPLWLIFGGETTVTVTGAGQGGRNQEMVLAASINLNKTMQGSPFRGEVIFMSGGTDGIDGPTDAAGALTYWKAHNGSTESQVLEASRQDLMPEVFLQDNNSYAYFSSLSAGKYLFKPGHTGTNVMDVQILLINPSY